MQHLEELFSKLKEHKKRTVAVVQAEDAEVLKAVKEAEHNGFCHFILYGNGRKMSELAKLAGLPLESPSLRFVETEGAGDAAERAVIDVASGKADVLMKGQLDTKTLLQMVLKKDSGLRGKGVISHVALFEIPRYHKLLLLTDAAMNISPDVQEKASIVRNAVHVARSIGIPKPKVAPLAAIESVNSVMQATVEADQLHHMQQNGELKGCVVAGPMAFDIAISAQAASQKKMDSPVAGQTDILLAPTIETGNALYKSFVYFGGGHVGAVITGAKAPIVLTSRSDNAKNKLYSLALALLTTN